jgi:hypothetical protein
VIAQKEIIGSEIKRSRSNLSLRVAHITQAPYANSAEFEKPSITMKITPSFIKTTLRWLWLGEDGDPGAD